MTELLDLLENRFAGYTACLGFPGENTAALSQRKNQGAQTLTYFCDEQAMPVLKALGFRCAGQYILYTKKLGAG